MGQEKKKVATKKEPSKPADQGKKKAKEDVKTEKEASRTERQKKDKTQEPEDLGFWRKEGKKIKRIVFFGPQKSPEWHKSRKFRITGSKASCVHDKDGFKTKKETADIICGRFKEEVNEHMLRGIEHEDAVRKWYEKTNKVTVEEVGFAYMHDRPYIGVSPDGLVEKDGLIEIKCPKRLYWLLKKRSWRSYDIWTSQGDYSRPNHIFASHYTQMQMQMAIMERKWCDYVVYSLAEDLVYEERVEFNEVYWNALLKDLDKFVDKYLTSYKCYVPKGVDLTVE